MAYPRRLLADNEQIVLEFHPHWWQIVWPVVLSVVLLAGGIAFWVVFDWEPIVKLIVVAILVVVWVAYAGWPLLSWRFDDFILTTDRVINRRGIFAKTAREIPVESISNVSFNQNVIERVLHAGDLVIESAGEDSATSFSNIRDPEMVQTQIHRTRERNNRREMTTAFSGAAEQMAQTFHEAQPPAPPVTPPPGPPPTPGDIPAQIERLAQLVRQGALTQAEFDAKKAELLGRM